MPAPALEVESTGRFQVRLSCGGTRHRIRLGQLTRIAAQRRAELLFELAKWIRKRPDRHALLVEAASDDTSEAALLDAIERARKRVATADKNEPTFASVGKQWTDGAIAKRYPGLKGVVCRSPKYAPRLAVLNQTIGSVTIRAFRLEDAERALAALPKRAKAATTRSKYLALIRRVLGLAVYPLRLRADNPIPEGFQLATEPAKARPYLYPSEDRQLLACEAIPLARRCLWGLLAREGLRLSEALALTRDCIDFERGALRLDKNKTRTPRSWALSPGVAPALAKVWPSLVDDIEPADAAALLRADLDAAKVDRAELFLDTAERAPLRVHDLRGSFVTIALANGATETWVADRTGHASSDMIARYRRKARHAEELHLGTWAPLDVALGLAAPVRPPPSDLPGNSGTSRKRSGKRRATGSSQVSPALPVPAPALKNAENSGPVQVPVGSCGQGGQASLELDELARAVVTAINAGDFELARALLGIVRR